MIIQHYRPYPRRSGEFTINDLPGKLIWLKADAGVTKDASNYVVQWADQSGNNNHAVQLGGQAQPLWVDGQLNGKPVIRFFNYGTSLAFNELTTIRTCFFVIKHLTGDISQQPMLGHDTTYHWFGGNNGALFSNTYASANITGAIGKINGIKQYQSVMHKPVNYSIIVTKTTDNVSASRLAYDRTGTTYIWQGDYAEVIACDSDISDTDIVKVENLLSEKYGITTYTLDNIIPKMTANNSPSGLAICSSNFSGMDAFKAFDKSPDSGHVWASNGEVPAYIGYQFPSSKTVRAYSLVPVEDSPEQAPKAWLLQGSNNGSNWTDIDSQSGQTDWILYSKKFFHTSNSNNYTYYRLYISEVQSGSYARMCELEMYE